MDKPCDKCGRYVATTKLLVGFFMKRPVWSYVCKECFEKYASERKKTD